MSQRPWKGCASKTRFVMRHSAEKCAARVARKIGQPMYVYPCRHCLGHHLSRTPNDEFERYREQLRTHLRARVPVGEFVP